MATYEVEIPGQGKFRIESKTELSDAQVYKAASEQAGIEKMADPTSGMNTFQKTAAGAGSAVADAWLGIKQIAAPALDAIAPRKPTMSGLITGQPKSRVEEYEAEAAEKRALDAPLDKTTAGTVGKVGANMAMAIPAMFVPGANTYAGAAVAGGLLGATQPTVGDESRLLNTGIGAGAGVVGQGVGNAIGRAIRPVRPAADPVREGLVAEAAHRNIPLTAGQATGSRPIQITESVMENLPFTSGPQLAQKQAQQTAYNRAVGQTFGSAEDALTPDVMGAARTRIGQQFTDLSSRNTMQADQTLISNLGRIQGEANRYATPDVARIVNNHLDDVLAKIEPGDVMAGRSYRQLDSELGRISRGSSNGDVRNYVGQIRGSLREAMDNSISAADRDAWAGARREYSNLMTVAPIAARSETGDISGRTLLNAANNSNRNARFGGPSELADIGRVGRAFVADQVPNSGTAQRLAVQGLLTGGGAATGAIASGATGGDPLKGALIGGAAGAGGLLSPRAVQMLMNSPAGQRYLREGLLQMTPRQSSLLNAGARSGAVGLLGYSGQQ